MASRTAPILQTIVRVFAVNATTAFRAVFFVCDRSGFTTVEETVADVRLVSRRMMAIQDLHNMVMVVSLISHTVRWFCFRRRQLSDIPLFNRDWPQ